MELAVRYQINMALGDIQSIAHCERFANMILPMLWTEIVSMLVYKAMELWVLMISTSLSAKLAGNLPLLKYN